MTFKELGIRSDLIERLKENNITTAKLVQAQVIPRLFLGKSVIMGSESGSGKTLGYLLPLIQNMRARDKCSHLIVTPSSELTRQVYDEILKYGVDEQVYIKLGLASSPYETSTVRPSVSPSVTKVLIFPIIRFF